MARNQREAAINEKNHGLQQNRHPGLPELLVFSPSRL
jgi:hypothetical protein